MIMVITITNVFTVKTKVFDYTLLWVFGYTHTFEGISVHSKVFVHTFGVLIASKDNFFL